MRYPPQHIPIIPPLVLLINLVKRPQVNTPIDEPALVSLWNEISLAENSTYVNQCQPSYIFSQPNNNQIVYNRGPA